ncbi:DUF3667 domain-containing protein [Aquimarina sp. 2201CG5-10]|uniref:DUF3667 domain-containing protein n=1 Tax=Aquimarina callyspongiae TaxID=3098150 RepID=UPI002AB3689D|nr:DUF3667 domain-containing protein [Aquimarina sp. 2201CG5-10]MDY8138803.1 DUF3667 domain-containing protein [Aquimarina sp. 2201CG5-10]
MKETGRFLKEYRGNECLNCGVPLDVIDRYCHSCGQANSTKKLSFNDFFSEFFSSIFSYDSRLRHTILALLFRPGKISKDYIEGKRVKYSNPFRFYLSVSIIFFIINGLFIDFEGMFNQFENKGQIDQKAVKVWTDSTDQSTKENKLASDSLITQPEKKISKEKDPIYYTESQIDTMGVFIAAFNRWETYREHYKKTKQKSSDIALDSLHHKKNWYTKYIYKRSMKTNKLSDNPTEYIKFIFNNLPFIIFFFLPFFALAIWLLYLRRPFTYMEHLVFTFHNQTMFFILMGISMLIDKSIGSDTATNIAMFIFLFYVYKAMRKFYAQKRGKTIVKFLLVNILFFILAGIGSVLTMVGSVFIF